MNAAVGPSPLLGQIGAKIGASSLGKPIQGGSGAGYEILGQGKNLKFMVSTYFYTYR